MMRCGLLGEKLGHSYSPAIHAQLADYAYGLYEVAPEETVPKILQVLAGSFSSSTART